MKQLFVWVRRADGAIHLAGELATRLRTAATGASNPNLNTRVHG
jgi:hypothetical protein